MLEWKISTTPIPYEEALNFMENRVNNIIEKKENELIWFLEHPPIYTMGTSANDSELLTSKLPVYKTGRGGKITYHGPGQRVCYVMLDLKKRSLPDAPDLKKYIFNLESWIINVFTKLGIDSSRRKNRIGIWVEQNSKDEKIAAIGIRVRKWVSYHGLAINVNPNLNNFDGIIPCGLNGFGVTSLAKLGVTCSFSKLDAILKSSFEEIFTK